MPRSEARIKTRIWDDDLFAAQEAMSKLVYFTVLSQSKLNLCGVISYTPTAWAEKIGVTKNVVHKGVLSLQSADFVLLDLSTEELWVRTLTKNDGILDKPYMVVAMSKEFRTIDSRTIRGRFLDGLGAGFVKDLPERFPKAFDSPTSKGLDDSFLVSFHDWFGR